MFSNVFSGGTQAPSRRDASNPDEEVSLTSLLPTPALRTELALLVALSTDSMRRNLLSTFDAPKPLAPVSPIPPAADDLISFDDDSQKADTSVSAATTDQVRMQRARELSASLSSPQMQGFRRAALSSFDAWQVGVLRRVGEVLGVRSEAVRRARREHAASAAALAEEKKVKQYRQWADGYDEGKEDGKDAASKQHILYPPITTRLVELLDEPKRVLLLHCLLLLLLSLEQYTAHSRALLLRITSSLSLSASALASHESSVAAGLLNAASSMSADESAKKSAATDSVNRKWKVGLATVAGAALIGVTGGLAAPILAAGVGTVMGGLGLGATAVSGLLGSLAGSTVLIGGLFGAYGGRMTGRMMERYAKEVEDFKFIPLAPSTDGVSSHKLRVAIAISGWLTTPSEADVTAPWEVLSPFSIEPFALRFELSALLRLGKSLTTIALKSYAIDTATLALLRQTVLAGLLAGLVWPIALLKLGSLIDNPFSVAMARTDKAGRVLADALIDKCQGERPVTLIGYSLGARVIYSCLLSLAERNAFGLVEDVILIGAPAPASGQDWVKCRAVVSGRLVNAYASDDWVLGFLYRTSSVQFGVAGLGPIEGVHGVENVDTGDLVKGHLRWKAVVGQVLESAGWGEDLDVGMVEEERRALEVLEWEEEQRRDGARRDGDSQHVEARGTQENSLVDLGVSTEKAKKREKAEPGRERHLSTAETTTFTTNENRGDTARTLARETERKLYLSSPPPPSTSKTPSHTHLSAPDEDSDEGSDDDDSGKMKIQMQDLDPMPEPEPEEDHHHHHQGEAAEPDKVKAEHQAERVRFGSPPGTDGERGFDLFWDA